MTKGRIKAITNLAIAMLLLANAILTAMGKSPLPFDQTEVTEMISYVASIVATLWAWWKNNNMTIEAETGQAIIDEMKANRGEAGGDGDPLDDPEDPEEE